MYAYTMCTWNDTQRDRFRWSRERDVREGRLIMEVEQRQLERVFFCSVFFCFLKLLLTFPAATKLPTAVLT